MKKNLALVAVAAVALVSSCTDKKTTQDVGANDSTSVATVADTLATANGMDLASVAGTYAGTLPAADCPGIETVLTINADSTYQIEQNYIDRKDGHDEASGVLQVLDGSVIMLVRPSSGEQTYYKVKDTNSLIMTDSLGNEPEGEMAQLYVLTKKQ